MLGLPLIIFYRIILIDLCSLSVFYVNLSSYTRCCRRSINTLYALSTKGARKQVAPLVGSMRILLIEAISAVNVIIKVDVPTAVLRS